MLNSSTLNKKKPVSRDEKVEDKFVGIKMLDFMASDTFTAGYLMFFS